MPGRPAASGGIGWSEVPNIPFSRSGELLAYDAADGYVLMFGGEIYTGYSQAPVPTNETWTYVAGTWTNLTHSLTVAPPAEIGELLVYDAADHYVVLQTAGTIRVNGSNVASQETWTFAAGNWTRIHPALTPGPLSGASAVYDSSDGYVLVFGGSSSRSTWTFAKGNWSELNTTPAPWARTYAIMVDDPTAGDVLLSGGYATISGSLVATNDTWTYGAGNWTQVDPAPSSVPTQTGGLVGATYDPSTSAILAFVYCYYGTGVYQYANGSWLTIDACGNLPVLGPPTYDVADSQLLTLAGPVGPDATNPTWLSVYSYWNGSVALVSGPPGLPAPSATATMADDSGDGYLLYYDQGGTMTFNGSTWLRSRSTVEPSANQCSNGVMTYDVRDGYDLLFCGQTWEYRNANWTRATQAPSDNWPSFYVGASIAYDAKDGYAVLFGGSAEGTWTWSGGNWTNVTASAGTAPSTRLYPAMCYDSVDGYVVLFGGLTTSYAAAFNDTWTFSGGNWTELRPTMSPAGRGGAGMAFDTSTGYAVLFGGELSAYSWLTDPWDTWEFVGGNWTNATSSAPGPAGRIDAAMAYENETAQIVLLGGWGAYTANPSEWVWGAPQRPAPPSITGFASSPSTTDVGVSTMLRVTVFGGASPRSYNYSGLPTGCPSSDKATLACDPSSAGIFHVGVNVTDSYGRSIRANTTLVVNPRPTISTFSIAPSMLAVGQTVSVTFNWSGGTSPVGIGVGGLPPGCPGPYDGSFTCQPSAPGDYTIAVSVLDILGVRANASATLTVVSPTTTPPLNLTAFTVQPSVVNLGDSVVVATTTTGGLGAPAFAYSGLPPGCPATTLPSFFCTPTKAGEYTVTVSVTDHTPATVHGTALLLVNPATGPGAGAPPPSVTNFTVTPSNVEIGQAVSFSVAASGGSEPYTFEFANLPSGCESANTSILACVPEAVGEFVVTVTVTDPGGQFGQRITSLTVNGPTATGPPPVTPPPVTAPPILPQPLTHSQSIASGALWLIGGAVATMVVASAVLLAALRPRK